MLSRGNSEYLIIVNKKILIDIMLSRFISILLCSSHTDCFTKSKNIIIRGPDGALDNSWRREREVPSSSPVGRICFVGCY